MRCTTKAVLALLSTVVGLVLLGCGKPSNQLIPVGVSPDVQRAAEEIAKITGNFPLQGTAAQSYLRITFRDYPTDAQLAQMKPHLQAVNVPIELWLDQGDKITDAGMEHLKGLTTMRFLDVGSQEVTDAGVQVVADMTSMKE